MASAERRMRSTSTNLKKTRRSAHKIEELRSKLLENIDTAIAYGARKQFTVQRAPNAYQLAIQTIRNWRESV